MNKKVIMTAALVLAAGAVMTGCGKTTINLNDYLTLTSSGYDTVGKAEYTIDWEKLVADNPDAFKMPEGNSDLEGVTQEDFNSVIAGMALPEIFSGSLDKDENLSNGDVVTFQWDDVDTAALESLQEELPVTFKYSEQTLEVSGLGEAKTIDLFEDLQVTFEGIAPDVQVIFQPEEVSACPEAGLRYVCEIPEGGIKNGDTISVGVCREGESEPLNETGLADVLKENGFIASSVEKEFPVEGLSAYAATLEEIPEDMMEKLKKQSEDIIKADCAGWGENGSLKGMEFLGCYFLSAKPGTETDLHNELYCVYKMNVDLYGYARSGNGDAKVHGDVNYYNYCRFEDILLLTDGTASADLSKGTMCDARFESDYAGSIVFGMPDWHRPPGYKDLDSMFNDCVTTKIAEYDYESSVEAATPAAPAATTAPAAE